MSNDNVRKKTMEVCVKQGEIVNKHLKVEMNVGDVLCYGLDEKLVSRFTLARRCFAKKVVWFFVSWRLCLICVVCGVVSIPTSKCVLVTEMEGCLLIFHLLDSMRCIGLPMLSYPSRLYFSVALPALSFFVLYDRGCCPVAWCRIIASCRATERAWNNWLQYWDIWIKHWDKFEF